jgi:hypothetical protein
MKPTMNHSLPTMKAHHFLSLLVLSALTVGAQAQSSTTHRDQTIEWGSAVPIHDSKGQAITSSSGFVFELGAFDTFIPEVGNMAEWYNHWKVFDKAEINAYGIFTGTAEITEFGNSSDFPVAPGFNPPPSPIVGRPFLNFEGLNAYLWVRNSNGLPFPNASEWLLVRSSTWVFPTQTSDCCAINPPLEWSVSDLRASDLPKFGYQGGPSPNPDPPYRNGTGGGTFTPSGLEPYIQTATPELSSSVLIVILGVLGLTDRRRTWRA